MKAYKSRFRGCFPRMNSNSKEQLNHVVGRHFPAYSGINLQNSNNVPLKRRIPTIALDKVKSAKELTETHANYLANEKASRILTENILPSNIRITFANYDSNKKRKHKLTQTMFSARSNNSVRNCNETRQNSIDSKNSYLLKERKPIRIQSYYIFNHSSKLQTGHI